LVTRYPGRPILTAKKEHETLGQFSERGKGQKREKEKRGTCFAKGDLALVGLRLRGGVLGLAGGTFGQVGLVALALSVGQVVALVVVESETQFALVAPEMVAHEIGVLR